MNEPNKVKELIKIISHFHDVEKDEAERLFRIIITAILNLLNENESFKCSLTTGKFKDYLIKITKHKIKDEKKEKNKDLKNVKEIIKSTYEIPLHLIGTKEAAITTGVKRRRIQYLIDSGKVESKKVRYGDQIRVLISKDSLYKIHPEQNKIRN